MRQERRERETGRAGASMRLCSHLAVHCQWRPRHACRAGDVWPIESWDFREPCHQCRQVVEQFRTYTDDSFRHEAERPVAFVYRGAYIESHVGGLGSAAIAGVTCHSDVSNCGSLDARWCQRSSPKNNHVKNPGTQITDGNKCTDSATFSGAVATASTELCTSKYWVQLDLGLVDDVFCCGLGPSRRSYIRSSGATLSNDAPTKLVNKVRAAAPSSPTCW